MHKKSQFLVRDLIFHDFTGEKESVISFSLEFLGEIFCVINIFLLTDGGHLEKLGNTLPSLKLWVGDSLFLKCLSFIS